MLVERIVEWTREWEQKGRKEGKLAVVLRLLERKFGPLEAVVRERLDAADPGTLLEWGERVLTAGR